MTERRQLPLIFVERYGPNAVQRVFTERQRVAMRLHFGLETGRALSFNEIAREIGVSRSTARTHVERAMNKLRNPIRAERGWGDRLLQHWDNIHEQLSRDPDYQVLNERYSEIIRRRPDLSEAEQEERRELLRLQSQRSGEIARIYWTTLRDSQSD